MIVEVRLRKPDIDSFEVDVMYYPANPGTREDPPEGADISTGSFVNVSYASGATDVMTWGSLVLTYAAGEGFDLATAEDTLIDKVVEAVEAEIDSWEDQ